MKRCVNSGRISSSSNTVPGTQVNSLPVSTSAPSTLRVSPRCSALSIRIVVRNVPMLDMMRPPYATPSSSYRSPYRNLPAPAISRVHVHHRHHVGPEVLGDVAVKHPRPRV